MVAVGFVTTYIILLFALLPWSGGLFLLTSLYMRLVVVTLWQREDNNFCLRFDTVLPWSDMIFGPKLMICILCSIHVKMVAFWFCDGVEMSFSISYIIVLPLSFYLFYVREICPIITCFFIFHVHIIILYGLIIDLLFV